MTHTRIVDADGNVYMTQAAGKARRNKIIAIVAGIAATPFMLAALAGVAMGIAQGPDIAPTLPTRAEKALTACEDAPDASLDDCIGLYLRPAYTVTQRDGSRVDTPAGPMLVAECLTQDLDKAEMRACLDQPIG